MVAILESDARKAVNNPRLSFDTYFEAVRAQETIQAWYKLGELGCSGASIWKLEFPDPVVTKL